MMRNAMIYFLISAFSFPFLAVFNACAATYRSMGNSGISMRVSVGMNIFNAVGNAILIFGLQLGTAGAALSTLAARMLGAVVMMVLIRNRKNDVYVTFKNLFVWERNMVQRILHIAIPNGVENGLFQLGRVLVVSIISRFGTAQIAANAVANNLDAMGCIAGQAMNLAMITVVGQCMGAGEKDQAVWYTKKLWKFTYQITAAVNGVILLAAAFIKYIQSDAGGKAVRVYFSLHSRRLRDLFVANLFHDAQCAAGSRGCEIYNGGFGGFHVYIPHRIQRGAGNRAGAWGCRRLDRHGLRLDLPRVFLQFQIFERKVA